MIDWFTKTAQRCHGKPENWQWCSVDSHNKPDDFFEMKGAIPIGEFRSGPRKGRPKFPKEVETIWVRFSELKETKRLWEVETGKCSTCEGKGQKSIGWNVDTGAVFSACKDCNSTGKAGVK